MHELTQNVVTELDVLYGLYQMATDLSKRIAPHDDDLNNRLLDARKKILDHTSQTSAQVALMLTAFQAEKFIPPNEKALVEEKRSLVLDVGLKMQTIDNQMVRLMQSRMQAIRSELAEHTDRKNGIKAYIQAPKAFLQVQ